MTALTASALIIAGYRDAQKLARGATLPADLLTEGLDRLNDLINLWQSQGLKLFLDEELTVPLVAGKQLYSFRPLGDVAMPRPLLIKQAAYWESTDNSRPLIPISRQEWTHLSSRTAQGSVNQYFADKLADRLDLYLWQVPDTIAATGTIHVVVRKQAFNPVNLTDAVTFPPEWAIALRWGIADEVAFGQPEAVQARCQSRAQAYRQALEDWDVEDAETYFQPDPRAMSPSKFR